MFIRSTEQGTIPECDGGLIPTGGEGLQRPIEWKTRERGKTSVREWPKKLRSTVSGDDPLGWVLFITKLYFLVSNFMWSKIFLEKNFFQTKISLVTHLYRTLICKFFVKLGSSRLVTMEFENFFKNGQGTLTQGFPLVKFVNLVTQSQSGSFMFSFLSLQKDNSFINNTHVVQTP